MKDADATERIQGATVAGEKKQHHRSPALVTLKLLREIKINSSGLGMDPNIGTITSSGAWWKLQCEDMPTCVNFRKGPLEFEELLAIMFEDGSEDFLDCSTDDDPIDDDNIELKKDERNVINMIEISTCHKMMKGILMVT
ncbi:hypothetical protein GUJ93_ZPchr0001g30084 [Zizania palustris]|uniref:Uncharacterized protein n=1 Tax=Zizania palustris TaxID=103762 RepID=A0A8J5RZX9_ZIZPA|nr:hypothetical protein GUJ93_ZPchr0001g30084 [Zizania palustris]